MFYKIERIIFNSIFLVFLLVPLLFANRKEGTVSAAENRALAKPAKLYNQDGSFNSKYFSDVEKWFDDNLGLRDILVEANGKAKYYLFDKLNSMRLGANGELAPFSSLADYQHTNLLSEDKIDEIAKAYQTVFDYLSSQGIQVYYVQCWDKHTIYPEQYTDTIQVFGNVSRSDQVEQALIEKTDLDVVPIKDTLINLKGKYNLYGTWAEPWHWVHRGAYEGYKELIKEINKNNDNRYKELCEDDFNIEIKDVGRTFYNGIHQIDNEEVFSLKDPHAMILREKLVYIPEAGEKSHAAYFENYSVENDDTILVLGDSYFHDFGFINNLAESFHTTIMFNGTAATNDNLIKIITTYDPDIVVFENAERCNYRFDEMVRNANDLKTRSYSNGEEIIFYSNDSNSEKYIINGFSNKEDGFTWTDGNEANLFFYTDGFEENVETHVFIDILGVFNTCQKVKMLMNGKCIYDQDVNSGGTIDAKFTMPKTNMLSLSIILDDAVSPFEVGQSLDRRKHSLQVVSLKIQQ